MGVPKYLFLSISFKDIKEILKNPLNYIFILKNDVLQSEKLLKPIFLNIWKNWMLDPENLKSRMFSTIIFGSKGIFPKNFSQIGKKCLTSRVFSDLWKI